MAGTCTHTRNHTTTILFAIYNFIFFFFYTRHALFEFAPCFLRHLSFIHIFLLQCTLITTHLHVRILKEFGAPKGVNPVARVHKLSHLDKKKKYGKTSVIWYFLEYYKMLPFAIMDFLSHSVEKKKISSPFFPICEQQFHRTIYNAWANRINHKKTKKYNVSMISSWDSLRTRRLIL